MILVTGATGQLGRLVIDQLLARVPASDLVAAVRDPSRAADLAARGVLVRRADYDEPASLDAALAGVDRLLLISSNDIEQRVVQHRHVIEAATRRGVELVAYTSLLRADTTPMRLAAAHLETERLLAASGLPHAILRNGWYTENHTGTLAAVLQHGAVLGSAGAGRFATASRADYATAAAVVLTRPEATGGVHELAGDSNYTLAEFAAEVARQSGREVAYHDLPQAEYETALLGFGLPAPLAKALADADAQAARGALDDHGGALGRLIGHPTTPLAAAVAAALAEVPRG